MPNRGNVRLTQIAQGDLSGQANAVEFVTTNGVAKADGNIGIWYQGNLIDGGVPAPGGVKVLTASYSALPTDSDFLLVFNGSSSPLVSPTLTLPGFPPFLEWQIHIQNIGVGAVTINRNGLLIDEQAANLTLLTNQGVYLATDGSNYFTERGLSALGGAWKQEAPSGTMNGTNKVFTLSATPTGNSLDLILNGVVQDLGVDYTLSTATITYTVAPKSTDQMKAVYTH